MISRRYTWQINFCMINFSPVLGMLIDYYSADVGFVIVGILMINGLLLFGIIIGLRKTNLVLTKIK